MNRLLIETFDRFVVLQPDAELPDAALHNGGVAVEPVLRPEVVERLMQGSPFEDLASPPMEWIQAVCLWTL